MQFSHTSCWSDWHPPEWACGERERGLERLQYEREIPCWVSGGVQLLSEMLIWMFDLPTSCHLQQVWLLYLLRPISQSQTSASWPRGLFGSDREICAWQWVGSGKVGPCAASPKLGSSCHTVDLCTWLSLCCQSGCQYLRTGRKYQSVSLGSSRLICSDLKLRVHVSTVTPHCSGEGGDPDECLCLMRPSSLTHPFHEKTSSLQQFRVSTTFTETIYVCWSSLGISHRLVTHLCQHIWAKYHLLARILSYQEGSAEIHRLSTGPWAKGGLQVVSESICWSFGRMTMEGEKNLNWLCGCWLRSCWI